MHCGNNLVFPARAGMIPGEDNLCLYCAGIPRESGDDPYADRATFKRLQYSPRERG